jgi:long-subunit fatty acid transport protein
VRKIVLLFLRERLLAAAAAALLLPRSLLASPIDDPHIGGIGFSGPATGDLAAIYWNPAAVGLISDNQAMVAATGRLSTLSVMRQAIDPATGQPGGARTFPEARGRSTLHPIGWPPGPGGLLAVAAALGNRFTLGIGAYSPFAQQVSWAAAEGQTPTRFHAVGADLRHAALVPALAIRVGTGIRIGAAPGFLFSTGRLVFDEDTALGAGAAGLTADCGDGPCGVENPAAAAGYEVASGFHPFDSSLSFTLAGGIHIERPGWSLGLAYITRPLGTEGGGIEIGARNTRLTPPPRSSGAPLCPADSPDACVFGHLQYGLPDTVTAGFTYHLTPRLDLGVVFRWLNLSQHETIRIRLVGPATGALRTSALPEQIVLYRGFRDVVDTRLRAVLRLGGRAQLAGLIRVETSALAPERVSPGAVDGHKLEPALAARLWLTSSLALAAGYSFTFMLPVNTGQSVFDPTTEIACREAGGDIQTPACQARNAGKARPTAAGRYTQHGHSLSVSIMARL